MKLENLLSQKRFAIVERWFQLILDTYPADTSSFLKKQKDRFANPVGNTISQGIEAIYGELVQGAGLDKVSSFLDTIIRIRAIQDFSPSQAVAFVFSLKKAIREELENEALDEEVARELLALEFRIDGLALLSFDIYMKCREKVYELRANEVKNRMFKLLERANLISEIPDLNPGSEDDNAEKTE
jgi:hypothetical protein